MDLNEQLAQAQATIRELQEELAATNRGLIALNLELEQRVVERTRELEKSRQAAVNLARDATAARRQTESSTTALRESEERYATLFGRSPIAKALSRLPGPEIVDVNDAFLKLFGFSREELVGRTNVDLGISDRAAQAVIAAELETKGQLRHFEVVRVARGGERRTLSLNIDALTVGGQPHLLTTIEDITERKKAEEQVGYLASFPELNPNPVLEVELCGRPVYMNPTAKLEFGDLPDRGLAHPLLSSLEAEVRRVEHNGTRFHSREVSVGDRTYQQLLQPVESGRVRVYAIDITARKKAEAELAVSQRQLELANKGLGSQNVELRVIQESLRETVAELKRSNEELERFAYVASHDLQEPLRMVANYVGMLRQRYHGKIDERADKYIDYATDGAKRMSQLIQDLLTFSRLNTRKEPFVQVSLGSVLDQTKANLSQAIAESGAVIESGPLPEVNGDPTQLVQLFQNLIGNAIKFRSEATPLIRITTAVSSLQPSPLRGEGGRSEKRKPFWRISVSDNGIGIEPHHHAQIFELFKRLHRQEEYPGTGIGLAVCRKVVERHGGVMTVESAIGRGSTFTFTLPY